MRQTFSSTLAIIVLAVGTAGAQGTPAASPANPFSRSVKARWDTVKNYVADSARQMPEAEYGFRPAAGVRTFSELLGHLANEHYLMCSTAKGEANPNAEDFEKRTAKADMVKALADSIAYCDAVYQSASDARAFDEVKMFGQTFTRLGALLLNVTHDSEHYGNLVTYMRMKGQVPPSSKGQ